MRTLTVNLPKDLDLNDKEAKMAFASKLYELGKISLGQGAELVGCSKETFMEMLGNYGVSYFNSPPEDLDQDIKNASNAFRAGKSTSGEDAEKRSVSPLVESLTGVLEGDPEYKKEYREHLKKKYL